MTTASDRLLSTLRSPWPVERPADQRLSDDTEACIAAGWLYREDASNGWVRVGLTEAGRRQIDPIVVTEEHRRMAETLVSGVRSQREPLAEQDIARAIAEAEARGERRGLERAAKLELRLALYETCAVCGLPFGLDDAGPQHCDDCNLTDEHLHAWDDRVAAVRSADEQ